MAQKIAEANEHIAKAEKHLKTGFMKWKPDYDSAAAEFAKAAVAFKNAKQLERAKEAYFQEAEAHEKNRSEEQHTLCRKLPQKALFSLDSSLRLFHAAKAFEQAGMILKDLQRLPEAVELIQRAGMMYVENGTPDTAAMALERAGKMIEALDSSKAVDLYQQAAAVFENEERPRQAVELVGRASRLLVRQQKFGDAASSLQKEKSMYKEMENYPTCYKRTVAQVLVHLHRGDLVAAQKSVKESGGIPGFSGSEDAEALERLLEAFDQQDQDEVTRVCSSPLMRYMDNDYAKLALSLRVPGGAKRPPAAAGDAPLEEEGEEEEEDEFAGGLC